MAEFLTGTDLSAKIRDLLSGTNLRCAVAFWGDGAAKLLCTCSAENSKDAKIVCDLSMGGTYPPELKKLGAPHNDKLRFLNGLHAKVYISDAGAIVASANASSNGIAFTDESRPRHVEAGTFHSKDDSEWHKIVRWFDQIYKDAKKIDADALALARKRWSPPKGDYTPPVRPNSLLDMVRNDPEQFDEMGFVFVRHPNSPESVERARQAVGNAHSEEHEAINQWPPGDMFIGWDEENIRNWPGRFFEFWMPRNRLSVIAREVAYLDLDAQAVFSRRACRYQSPPSSTNGCHDWSVGCRISRQNTWR